MSEKPAPPEVRTAISKLIDSVGADKAAETLHVGKSALARAVAGFPVKDGTVQLVILGLSAKAD